MSDVCCTPEADIWSVLAHIH